MDGNITNNGTSRSLVNDDAASTEITLDPICSSSRPTVLSLFCGCGGLDTGFEQAGFDVGLAYDLRAPAVMSHNNARTKPSAFVRDVSKISLEDLDQDYGGVFSPNGVIGGPPCQSFSRGNSSKTADDPRRHMVARFFDLALKLHTERDEIDFIVMENVPEVAKAEQGGLLGREITRLKRTGFEVYFDIYDAADYGVAQRRRRLILVAINKKKLNSPWSPPLKCPSRPTVRDEIFGLDEPVFFNESKNLSRFPVHPNHWCMTPKSPKFTNASLKPGRSTGRSFKTLGWDKPSYTVSYGHREVHVHPNCTRRLSVYEAMLLQGFPKEFVLKGTMSAQFSQVSEAVPPPMARVIANSILLSTYAKN